MTTANVNLRQVLLKRGNSYAISSYTGPVGEIVIDTTANSIRVQDGVTPGGHLIATTTSSTNIASGAFYANVDQVTGQVNVKGNLIPDGNAAYNFGSATNQWGNIYSAGTIYVGNLALTNSSGQLSVNGNPIGNIYSNANVASYLPTSSVITGINANVAAANAVIATLAGVNANVAAANAAILINTNSIAAANAAIVVANTALKGYVDTQLNTLTNGAAGALDTLLEIGTALGNNANFSGVMVTWLGNITANVNAANIAWTANAATQAGLITSLQSNAGVQADAITTVTATAQNLSANIGGFYNYANATYATTSGTYSNTNVAAYLTVSTIIANINSNVSNANIAWQANAATQLSQITAANTNISALQANLGSYYNWANANVVSLYNSILGANANAGVQADAITSLNVAWQANAVTQLGQITAANTNISALQANIGSYYIWANANVAGLYNSITGANTAWTANAAAQAGLITNLQSNTGGLYNSILGANAAIVTANTALKGYVDTQLNNLTNGASTALDTLIEIGTALGNNANFSSVMVTWLGNITANVNAANASISATNTNLSALQANLGATQIWANANIASVNANVTSVNTSIASIRANLGATQIWANANIASINANLGVTQINIASINANLGATQIWANANIASINANLGATQIWANANIATLRTQIGSLATGANANTAAYLASGTDATISTIQNTLIFIEGTIGGNVGQALAPQASVDAANAAIGATNVAWQANAAVQLSQITAANAAIVTANTGMKSYVDNQLSTLTNGASTALDTLLEIGTALGNNANFSSVMVTWLGNITANVNAANASISALQSNTGSLQNQINGANAAIVTANTAMKSYVDSANTAQQSQLSSIVSGQLTLTNSVATAQVNIAALTSSVSGFYTWANANFGTGNYSNTTVASYLPVYNSNIGAFSVKPTGNSTTGFNGLYVGQQTGFVVVPNLQAQFTANNNSYSQINSQNILPGNQSTTDYVATADNGTNTINYIDMGIAGSAYDGTQPNNSLGTSLYPNDGYVYVQGNTAGVVGGNLVLGTTTPGTGIRFLAGGINSSNVAVAINNPGTDPISNSTGALVVTGGVGISGNLNVGQYNTSLHNIRGNVLLGLGNVAASADSTLTINQNSTTPPIAPNNVVHMSALDGKNAQYGADSYGAGANSGIYFRKARGTSANPQAIQTNDLIGVVSARGYGVTGYASLNTTPTHIAIYATENFTDTAQGTGIIVRTNPAGSNSAVTTATFTANSVTINSNLNIGQFNTSLHNIKGNLLLGIGNVVASTDSILTINQNSSVPLVAPNNVVHMSALDGKSGQFGADSFGAGAVSSIYLRKARGTSASPSAVQSGDYIGTFAARGYGATGFAGTSSGLIGFYAIENFTDQAQGTGINIKTVPIGTNSAVITTTILSNLTTINSDLSVGGNINAGVYNTSLHNIKGNVLLGIGNVVASSDSILTINQNSATPAIAPNSVVHMSALDGKTAQYGADSYGTGANSGLYLRKARGTSASPSAVQSGDTIGFVAARGYGTNGYSVFGAATQMSIYALENFTDQAQGTGISLRTNPVGSNVATTTATFLSNTSTINSSLAVAGNVYHQSAYYDTYSNVSNTGGNLTLNFVNGAVYYATLTANATANIVSVSNTTFTTTKLTIIVDQGATPYHITNIQFNGSTVSNIKWLGGTVPTGTANNTDVIVVTLINLNNGTYRVLGQQSSYA